MARTTRLFSRTENPTKKIGCRKLGIEPMEPRYLLSADPIDIGIVYLEQDAGADSHGDRFELTFRGGAPDTELRRIIIDGDQQLDGFSIGDSFFDTSDGGLGADTHVNYFSAEAEGIDEIKATVSDGGTQLILEFDGFDAGETLVFEVDVDEVEDYNAIETDIDFVNDGFDPITSGVEFQGSHLTAEFTAPHYFDVSGNSTFLNRYDDLLEKTELPLPSDNDNGQRDRSAAAFVLDVQQQPLPATISGRVQLSDENGDCFGHEENHEGIAGATVYLLDADGNILEKTETDANGDYEFSDLLPGVYGVREVTPDQLHEGGARAGNFNGEVRGVVDPFGDVINININGGDNVDDLDFCEHVGANLSGHVYHDRNNDGVRDSGEEPIEAVIVTLLDASGAVAGETKTDDAGYYEFLNLPAGEYSVIETQPTGYLDGIDKAGEIDGRTTGVAINPGDRIDGVTLGWHQQAVNYDFAELKTSAIRGRVHQSTRDGDCFTGYENHAPVVGATIQLLDADGNAIAETLTDSDGMYEFVGLMPGEYGIREITPNEYLKAGAQVGGVDGNQIGDVADAETILGIHLDSEVSGEGFDFCVHRPAMISGAVYHDANNDGQRDAGETSIEGVVIELLDADGNVVDTTTTDSNGEYKFGGIIAGEYSIREIHPEGYLDGLDSAGTIDGTTSGRADSNGDTIRQIDIGWGDMGQDYNFGELRPGTIAGRIHADIVLDCVYTPEEGDQLLAGVTVQLFDSGNNLVAETQSDANGEYAFNDLRPGDYRVRQIQPDNYFDGDVVVGNLGGQAGASNELLVNVGSGDQLANYNFCETTPASLSGYVFQDGEPVELKEGETLPERIRDVRDGQRTSDDQFLPNVTIELRDGTTGLPIYAQDAALPGTLPDGVITAITDVNGFYAFPNLRPGSYAVFQTSQPSGLFDGIDTPGTTSGLVFNPGEEQQTVFLADGVETNNDAIIRISLPPGTQSLENNFSEVAVNFTPQVIPDPPPVDPPITPINPNLPRTPIPPSRNIPQAGPMPFASDGPGRGGYQLQPTGGGSQLGRPRTWHLSVINGGQPRGEGVTIHEVTSAWFASANSNPSNISADIARAEWVMPNGYGDNSTSTVNFGMPGAIPFAGDFNGDGYDEIGVYVDGEWFIDLDGDGKFDEGDLWARLGTRLDLPVTGDWDGDGKVDIGIFGREWLGDQYAISNEPGLPDAENETANEKKNIPPGDKDADGERIALKRKRLMQKRMASRAGRVRADVVDHVFRFGHKDDIPVTGDWNGDGITTIGVFRKGAWHLDVDGNGRHSEMDRQVEFGRPGDTPLVGDFDGDGQVDLAVFRAGELIIDSNGNGKIDSSDERKELGAAGDVPVVGDFDGDGVDEVALYRAGSGDRQVVYQAKRAG